MTEVFFYSRYPISLVMFSTIKLLIICHIKLSLREDDKEIFSSLLAFLKKDQSIELISIRQLIESFFQNDVPERDVIIIDISLPGVSGID